MKKGSNMPQKNLLRPPAPPGPPPKRILSEDIKLECLTASKNALKEKIQGLYLYINRLHEKLNIKPMFNDLPSEDNKIFQEYKKVPRTVLAAQFTNENKDKIFNSLMGQHGADFENNNPILRVKTVHGDIVIVRLNDWIIPDEDVGTYYPIKDKIFRRDYNKE